MKEAFDRLAQKIYKVRKQALLIAMVAVLLVVINKKEIADHQVIPEPPTLDPSAPENKLPEEIKEIVDADELRKYYESIDLSNYEGDSLVEGLYRNGYDITPEFLEGLADFYGIKGYTGTPEQDLELLNILRGPRQELDTPTDIEYGDELPDNMGTPTNNKTPGSSHNPNKGNTSNNTQNPIAQPGDNTNSELEEPTLPSVTPGDNNKPTIPDDSNYPTIPSNPGIINPNHQHKWSLWSYLNALFEQRSCACGAKEVQGHSFRYKGRKLTPKTENTHTEALEYTCTSCHYKKTEESIRNCEFEDIYDYDDIYEYGSCECGNEVKRLHNLDQGTAGSNGSTIYSCLNDGCSYSKEIKPDHKHKFIIVDYDKDKEYKRCSCGQTEESPHRLDGGTTAADGTTYYNCLNEGCSYIKEVKPDHNHKFIIVNYDENKEYKKCSCGQTEESPHRLDKGTTAADGTTTYSCLNEGCSYTKEVKPDHNHKFIIVNYDENKEYKKCSCGQTEESPHRLDGGTTAADGTTYYNCLNEGCNYIKEVKPQHTHNHIHVDDDDFKEYYECSCGDKYTLNHENTSKKNADCTTTYTCKNCGYVRTTPASHTEREYTDNTQTDEICYSTVTECKDCHIEIKRVPVPHPYELISSNVLGDTYACSICGKTMTKPSSHTHKEVEYIDNTQTDEICYSTVTECKDCHIEIKRVPVPHPYELISSNVLGDTYACSICGRTKTVPRTQSTSLQTTNSALEASQSYTLIRRRYK